MERQEIQHQIGVELATLAHVVSALRATMGWHVAGPDFSRKLSSLRFVTESFQRHLKRLLRLEQREGYLATILESRPDLGEEVKGLRRQHLEFRKGVRGLLARMGAVDPTDQSTFVKITDDLAVLLDSLDEHHRKETDLLQEALFQDEGGEG